MLNKKWFKALGISIPLLSALVLTGIFVKPETNLFSTGLTINMIIVVGQIFILWAIYRNHI